jgi:uncharacterized protein with von Willebrand factor type A (vWA) domain
MKRLIFDPPKWHLIQFRDHSGGPLPSPSDNKFAQLEDEIFERLYSGETERADTGAPPDLQAWAERIHKTLDQLPAFARLSAECRGDTGAAAAAVDALMERLADELPEATDRPDSAGKDALRRPATAACHSASRAVEELRDATEGLTAVALPGIGAAAVRPGSGERARPLAAQLRNDPRLRRIALLAGRMKRIAAAKRRQRVRHGADEITDVEQGADLARSLPAELSKLRHPRRRLDFMRSLLERQVLQYQLVGAETLGKGPLIVLLDKSGSMDGQRDEWATALALALLEHAHSERRSFALVDFNYANVFEATVTPGEKLPSDALFIHCGGGTDIAGAVARGLDLRASDRVLRKADIVLITDGGSDVDRAGELRERARAQNVSILGLAIGMPAEVLAPWCDQAFDVTNLSTVDERVSAALFAA